ncbi:MAG: hypothetical protein AAB689_00055 [Patescibacteria group bacterium]
MTITEAREKCKSVVATIPRDVLILTILILASSLSFGLGYVTGLDVGRDTNTPFEASPIVSTSIEGQVVASKSGTRYYLPECAGAERISDANKVWFTSASAASAAGYTLATNCKGL